MRSAFAATALAYPINSGCGYEFLGAKSCLFATDAPFDADGGRGLIRDTIDAVEALDISPAEREQIFDGNARTLLKLGDEVISKQGV